MIDIHVLTWSKTDPQWLAQCLESLQSPLCTVHVVEGVEGHIGKGRAKAYALGTHGYVGFVDSDDYVLPGTIERVCDELVAHDYHAVCTLENLIRGNDPTPITKQPLGNHHLFVAKRSVITPLLPAHDQTPRFAEKLAMHKIRPVQLPFVGYIWRQHSQQAHLRQSVTDAVTEVGHLWQ